MKNLWIISLLILTVSCGKELKTSSSEIEGDLNGCYELVEGSYKVSNDNGNNCVTVKITKTKETVPFTKQTVGAFGNDALTNAGFGFILSDKANNTVYEFKASQGKMAPEQQEEVLNLQPGETGEVTFIFPKDIKAEYIKLTSEIKFNSTGIIPLEGSVDKYAVKNFNIEFDFKNGKIIGQYQYKTSPAGAYLYLLGREEENSMTQGNYSFKVAIAEMNTNGNLSGRIWGDLRLIRESKDKPYHYDLVCRFLNSNYSEFMTNLESAPLDKLYENLSKPADWHVDTKRLYDYSKEVGFNHAYQ